MRFLNGGAYFPSLFFFQVFHMLPNQPPPKRPSLPEVPVLPMVNPFWNPQGLPSTPPRWLQLRPVFPHEVYMESPLLRSMSERASADPTTMFVITETDVLEALKHLAPQLEDVLIPSIKEAQFLGHLDVHRRDYRISDITMFLKYVRLMLETMNNIQREVIKPEDADIAQNCLNRWDSVIYAGDSRGNTESTIFKMWAGVVTELESWLTVTETKRKVIFSPLMPTWTSAFMEALATAFAIVIVAMDRGSATGNKVMIVDDVLEDLYPLRDMLLRRLRDILKLIPSDSGHFTRGSELRGRIQHTLFGRPPGWL